MSAESRKDTPKNPSAANPPVEEMAPAEDFAPSEDSPVDAGDERLRKLQAENKRLMDQLLRQKADMENFRKRAEREKDEFMQYTLFDTVKSLLPILDGFELALESEGGGDEYRKGVELIYQKLRAALEKTGLKAIETKGRQFNPRLHEAVATVETNRHPEHEIVEELQRGYYFKDRLLRPAMVKVAQRPSGHRPAKENVLPE